MIILVASELFAPYFGRTKVLVDLRKLRMVGVVFGVAFVFTVGLRILSLTYGF